MAYLQNSDDRERIVWQDTSHYYLERICLELVKKSRIGRNQMWIPRSLEKAQMRKAAALLEKGRPKAVMRSHNSPTRCMGCLSQL